MNEFDLKTFLHTVSSRKRRILLNTFLGALAGLAIGFSTPKLFTANASLTPEMTDENSMRSGMGGLASLAGIDLGKGTDAIGPNLYPDVISTNQFLVDLLDVQVETTHGEHCDFKTYMSHHCRRAWWDYGKLGMVKLMKAILPKKPKRPGAGDGKIDPRNLSEEEEQMVNGMRSTILCSVDDESGVIHLSVTTQDPMVSAIMVDSVMAHLQTFITHYRTSKACTDLAYYEQLEQSALADYRQAVNRYASYCDTHRGLTLQSYISEQESLENEMQMAYTAYSQVKQQVQMAKAKVQEKTPAFTVLEAASVPNAPTSPRKFLILFSCMFLACFGTVAWIYFRLLFPKKTGKKEPEQLPAEPLS